jgi:AmmeMemoRadiSam system protein A
MSYHYVLTDDEKRELLRIARATLLEHFHTGRIPPGKPHRDSLTAPAGAFVTLHNQGMLRGCIGTQLETTPLFRTIQEMAVAAATRDPRFEPVSEGEIEDIEIEVSVLGLHRPMESVVEIEIGVHGLTIEHGGRRGLLLPQVAREQRWSAEQFLENICAKAGLPGDAWSAREALVHLFTAQVFNDRTHPPMPLRFF